MAKHWDDLLKMLVRANPQAFVSLVVGDALFKNELDKELITRSSDADLLYNITWNGFEVVLHVEFQRRRDLNMGRRVWEYNVTTSCLQKRPVYSVVIYLVRDNNVVEPPYEELLPNGGRIHSFNFRNIKLWEIPVDTLTHVGLEGMLPLLPLLKDGQRRETVEQMVTGLQKAGKDDLLPIGFALAALSFSERADKQWLKERYRNMYDIIEDSWVYQDIIQRGLNKGLEEGLLQGLEKGLSQGLEKGLSQGLEKGLSQGLEKGQVQAKRQILVHFVGKRFPELSSLAQQRSLQLTDPETLQVVLDKLFDAQKVEEARQILLEGDTSEAGTG